MKYTISELANSKGVSPLVREALLHMEAVIVKANSQAEHCEREWYLRGDELEATNRQVEILSDALAESRREVAALKAVQEPVVQEGYTLVTTEGYEWAKKLAVSALAQQAIPLTELQKDATNLLFALHDAWPYVHQHCTIQPKKKFIQALIVKHGDFADLQPPAQPAPVQEPVAKVDANDEGYWADLLPDRTVKVGQLLYTTPLAAQRQWVGLTDDEIDLFINGRGDEDDDDYVEPTGDGYGLTDADLVELVRRAEAKLKERNT